MLVTAGNGEGSWPFPATHPPTHSFTYSPSHTHTHIPHIHARSQSTLFPHIKPSRCICMTPSTTSPRHTGPTPSPSSGGCATTPWGPTWSATCCCLRSSCSSCSRGLARYRAPLGYVWFRYCLLYATLLFPAHRKHPAISSALFLVTPLAHPPSFLVSVSLWKLQHGVCYLLLFAQLMLILFGRPRIILCPSWVKTCVCYFLLYATEHSAVSSPLFLVTPLAHSPSFLFLCLFGSSNMVSATCSCLRSSCSSSSRGPARYRAPLG